MTGRHSYSVSSMFAVKYGFEKAPEWFLTFIIAWVSTGALVRGIDLGLDPSTRNEVYAYANILGANTWGWIQATTALIVLMMLACRWAVGMLAAQLAAIMVWTAYAIVVLQAVLGVVATDGGVRNAVVPLITGGTYLATFIATTDQLRKQVATDGGAR